MNVRMITSADDLKRFDVWIRSQSAGSLWQSLERKNYLEACGKNVRIYLCEEHDMIIASALVAIDRTIGGFSTWDIPRGPVLAKSEKREAARESLDALLTAILQDAKKDNCLALYLSSPLPLPATRSPLTASQRRIHAEATRIVDLSGSEEEILAHMHQKGRYNIRLAEKHGVTVRKGTGKDIDAFYVLLTSTSGRDGFKISQKSHYARFLSDLRGSFILIAERAGKPVAGLIGVEWPPPSPRLAEASHPSPIGRGAGGEGAVGIYYYGASSYEDRQLMAPYALQWEAMKHCKALGCTKYDLLGIAAANAAPDDPWHGITDFKLKFGGEVITYPPEQMLVLRPMMKTMLEWKRKLVG